MIRISFAILAFICMGFCSTAEAMTHPYHVSLAEVEWNEKSQSFEVALCVWPADLEKALSKQTGRSIDLDKEKQLELLIPKYLAKRFQIKSETVQSKIRWVGADISLKKAWLFFEVGKESGSTPGIKATDSLELENRIFFELNEDQSNQVQLKNKLRTRSVTLSRQKPNFEFVVAKPN